MLPRWTGIDYQFRPLATDLFDLHRRFGSVNRSRDPESVMRWWWEPSERDKWKTPVGIGHPAARIGLPAFDPRAAYLYGQALPRVVGIARGVADRPPVNRWMPPHHLMGLRWQPGAILLGKLGHTMIGQLDDRPMVTVGGARSGKTSTVLEPNAYLYPGSAIILDPKGELARKTAAVRAALGHDVHVLDPFGQSGFASSNFNLMAELDPASDLVIDDVATLTQAIIVDEGDSRARHWNDSARTFLLGLVLFALTLPKADRHLVTVRQLLSLTHPALLEAVKDPAPNPGAERDRDFYTEHKTAVETLLHTMANSGNRFDGILAAIGRRFVGTPPSERGSIMSTAAAQTDFLDSLPLWRISRTSDFPLVSLAGDRPTTIYLCLPVRTMERHFRWLRMIVQQACTTLEKLGPYPRGKPPILFLMEEFTTLGHMDIMERAAAYFPGFGVKLWAVIQDTTQLRRYYQNSWETFLGNAGIVQAFANSDQTTLNYLAARMEKLIQPFELRTAFSRDSFAQLLLFEGQPPAAALRLDHADVAAIRANALAYARNETAP